jgi:two-component system, chemotaxis family, protein-glutamate methylesterase/glutaminase
MNKRIRVLIVDDSALVRDILEKGLSADPVIEVIGSAPDVYVARDMIVSKKPDVLTLDIEMPRMDGIEFLRRLMPQFPLPVVVVSSLTQRGKTITIQALEAGAIDFVPKPTSDVARGLAGMMMELRTKIKIASTANVSHWKNVKYDRLQTSSIGKSASLAESTDKVVAIGASTGGTEALKVVINALPPSIPGIVVVQHMPAGFTKTFADRLHETSMLQVKEAEEGDRVMTGRCLIAPGNYHMEIVRSGGYYKVKLNQEDKVNGHRPSVDVLMHSVAKYAANNAYGVILTGMGGDGAKGLLAMREAGAKTFGQNEETCVVYGMPKVAYDMKAVETELPIQDIAKNLIRVISNDMKT